MKWFYNLKIGTKLLLSFVSVAFISGIIGLLTIIYFQEINERNIQIYENMLVPTTELSAISSDLLFIHVHLDDLVLANDFYKKEYIIDHIKKHLEAIRSNSLSFEKTILSQEVKNKFNNFLSIHKAFESSLNKLIDFVKVNKYTETIKISKSELNRIAEEEQESLFNLINLKNRHALESFTTSSEQINSIIRITAILFMIGVLIAISLGLFISSIIRKPIHNLVQSADSLADGDVNINVKSDRKDELGILAGSFKKMVGRIKEQTTIVDLIASGNLNVEVNIKSEKDILGKGLSIVTETLKKLINETIILTKAASEGKLSVRGNSEKFKGRYREIIEGINNTLDAVIGPLYLAAEYIERIGKHEIPNKITDIYKGDFKEISDNLNSCIDNVTSYRSAIERREQELKNALIESEQSKEYSEKIVDTANVMIICLDINGNIQVFNKDAENITGYRKDEVLNKNWFELIIPRQIYPEMMDLFSKWIREGSEEFLMNYENSIITKSGEKRYIEWQNSLLKEGDKIIGTISFGIDITEKKLAELEREVNYRISQAINTTENLEELLSVIHQNLKKIIYAENCYIALFDTETRLVSFPLFIDKFDSRPLPRIKSKGLTEYVLKTGKPLLISPDNLENLLTNNEVELIGSPPASWLGVPLIVHTETIGVLTVQSYDVNIKYSERDKNLLVNIGNQASFAIERKLAEKARIRLEKQLFRSQKMESLGRLAGGIAHDFNNVLTAIMGNADMLYNESDKQKSSRHALQIKKASQRGADLAKQLLAFAKMETYKIAPVSVNELLEETVKLLEHTFQKSIEIKLHNEKDLPLIDGDKSPLQQVFLNLCVNARDAMPDGGTLTFKTQIIFVDENLFEKPNELPPGNYVFISISDTGHGMSEEILQHIYDPFFTTKGEGKGTGLGLSIAYGIIKSHKGFITVDSQVNSGTTFKIYFPVSAMDVKQKTEENKVKQIIFGEGETILLVDDDEMVLEVNKDILVNINYKVITCSNGFDAIEIYKNRINEIDLIILDCAMPKMTGEETLKRLKEINPYVKVLMASGLINEPDVYKRIKEFDDCDFLYKPYNVEQLADAVNTTLRKKI